MRFYYYRNHLWPIIITNLIVKDYLPINLVISLFELIDCIDYLKCLCYFIYFIDLIFD